MVPPCLAPSSPGPAGVGGRWVRPCSWAATLEYLRQKQSQGLCRDPRGESERRVPEKVRPSLREAAVSPVPDTPRFTLLPRHDLWPPRTPYCPLGAASTHLFPPALLFLLPAFQALLVDSPNVPLHVSLTLPSHSVSAVPLTLSFSVLT